MCVYSPIPAQGRLDRLQALRGLAALLVCVSHFAEYHASAFGWRLLPPGASLGWLGVDVFFVLSGFIIARSALDAPGGGRAAAGFALARAARIYPPWWVALGCTALLATLAPDLLGYSGGASGLASVFLLPASEQPLLSVGWTLVMEMQFYAVFALLLLAPARMRAPLLAGWACLIAAGGISAWRNEGPWLSTALNPLCLEFLAGVAVAALIQNRAVRPVPTRLLVLVALGCGVAMVGGAALVTVMASNGSTTGAEWTRAATVGGPAVVLVWLAARLDMGSSFASPGWRRWSVALGDRSYALYLVHYPIVSATALSAAQWSGGAAGMALHCVAAITLTALATEAMHRWVERPAIGLSKSARHWLATTASAPQPKAL